MTAPVEKRVLVIDDDEVMLQSCQQVLERAGYRVQACDSGRAGLARIPDFHPALLVVDLKMPELDGLQVIDLARRADPELVVVVITGYATIETAVDAMKAGAYDFLPKPFTPAELRLIIGRSFERWLLAAESARLRQEKAELERKFAAVVSHQLKSPLAAIKQNLDVVLLAPDALPGSALSAAERARARLAEMLRIVEDWLTLARITKDTLSEGDATCDLVEVARAVGEEHRASAEAAGLRLELRLPGAPLPVRGDATSHAVLVDNLLSNGIKYNRPGGSLALALSAAAAEAVLEVSDTGIGIAEAHLPHLFQELYRVKSEATRGIAGTGLGLAICKKIVSELGGSIAVASGEGSGTTFTVRVPLCATDKAREGQEAS